MESTQPSGEFCNSLGRTILCADFLHPVDSLQQKTRRSRAQLISGLVYRSERRSRKLGEIEVVKSDNGYIFGTVQTQLAGRQQYAHRHQVIARKDCGWTRQHAQ